MTGAYRRRLARMAGAIALVPMMAATAAAQPTLPDEPPVPTRRPVLSSAVSLDKVRTGSLAKARKAVKAGTEATLLAQGLDALGSGDAAAAMAIGERLPKASLDRKILIWTIATGASRTMTSAELAESARQLEGWPGMALIEANRERALDREDPASGAVIAAFEDQPPITAEGMLLLARAHLAQGDEAAARKVLVPFWEEQRLDAGEEMAIIREFGSLIPKSAHRRRMEQMLYQDRITSAERVANLAGGRELTRAFAAVTRNRDDAGALLEEVPEAQRGAAYIFAKARHLRRTGKFEAAAEAMAEAPRHAGKLVDPDAWWAERRVLSRELLDIGEPEQAYRVAAAHMAERPVDKADAEFHAGWYALRHLADPARAGPHFSRIVEIADGPISLARGHYWLGRAAEAAGAEDEAKTHFERAARHGTVFYGQLAAARLGRSTIETEPPQVTPTVRRLFDAREAVLAIERLEAVGHESRAAPLYRALAEELTDPAECALLAEMAWRGGDHPLGLRVAKAAAARGIEVGLLTHPVGVIPPSAEISGPGKALAYAVARQESEFNVSARSGAGALGLLQLLPGTAQEMARKAGISYSKSKLTQDAGYNATLGAAYLQEQLDRFDGSYILTFIGYNAGPRRAIDWVGRYGDPQGGPIDEVVDWIERIPFTETRAYVQRVMENYQVYKMRLSGEMDIVDDLVMGRR